MAQVDPTRRFSDRVAQYVQARPSYPDAVVEFLRTVAGVGPEGVVADVGSGTGISSALFLRAGCTVFAVEPNAEMRRAAERLLGSHAGFRSVAGSAEATTLPDRSVDWVVAAQAFHWFDPPRTRREFARILRPDGRCVLLWNRRTTDDAPGRDYERLIREFAVYYDRVRHENLDAARFEAFFDHGTYAHRKVDNSQRLDRASWHARLMSSSYLPGEGHPRLEAMLAAADRHFDEHADSGALTIRYATELHYGRIT